MRVERQSALPQGRQQACRRLQVVRFQAVSEPREHRLEQCTGVLASTLSGHQLCQIGRGAQLPQARALLTALFKRLAEINLSLIEVRLRPHEKKVTLQTQKLGHV